MPTLNDFPLVARRVHTLLTDGGATDEDLDFTIALPHSYAVSASIIEGFLKASTERGLTVGDWLTTPQLIELEAETGECVDENAPLGEALCSRPELCKFVGAQENADRFSYAKQFAANVIDAFMEAAYDGDLSELLLWSVLEDAENAAEETFDKAQRRAN